MTNYDRIKKNNGESFAKIIRSYDNGIFEIKNIVEILEHAGNEAELLLSYLISLKDIKIEKIEKPIFFGELLNKAGYDYCIADTKEKQDDIKKYFKKGEFLCSFGSDRYKHYHIINIWKKNINEIKRENFDNPEREDEYGTSCMSIQIAKKGGFISIKNRYNHTVNNPDNTYKSNPDNIIIGLSASLKDYFSVDFSSQKTCLPEGYTLFKNKIIKFNYEINGVIFAENCYIKDGSLVELNKDYEIMLDYYILNINTRDFYNPSSSSDAFILACKEEMEGKKIVVTKNENYVEKDDEFVIIKIK